MNNGITYYISITEKPMFSTPGIVSTPDAIVPKMVKKLVANQGWTSFIDSEVKTYEDGTTVTTLYFGSKTDLNSALAAFPLGIWDRQSGQLATAD